MTVDLPEELLVEILTRVPEASLARFRSTSKGLNALIKNEARLDKKSRIIMLIDYRVYLVSVDPHRTHHDVLKVTSQYSLKDPLSNATKEADICDVFHCDGLLLCTTKENRLVVWNPSSGKTTWIKLTSPFRNCDIFALGNSSCNNYKILRMDPERRSPLISHHEIYDLTFDSWRRVSAVRDWFIPPLTYRGVSVNGNTYWVAFLYSEDGYSQMKKILLSFDFSTKRFRSQPLIMADDISYDDFSLSATREEQKLCLLATSRGYDHIDAWIATKTESTGAMSWTKFLNVENMSCFMFHPGMSFLADRENKVLICPGKHWCSNGFLHILGEDKYIHVDYHDAESICSHLVNYVPTLPKLQQGSLGLGPRKAQIT